MALLNVQKHIVNSLGEEEELNIYTTISEATTNDLYKIVQLDTEDGIITGYIGLTEDLDSAKSSSKKIYKNNNVYSERRYVGLKTMREYMKNTYPSTYQQITELTEELPDSSDCTDFYRFFYSCIKLNSLPEMDTRNGTNFNEMYSGCFKVTSVSAIDFSKATDVQLSGIKVGSMFTGCSLLKTITFNNLPIGTTESTLRTKCYIPDTVTEIIMNFREV